MYSKTAQYYDLVYSFKNYEEEAGKIKALIQKEHPAAKSILDVACGSAEHARYLIEDFRLDGIDLQPEFVEIAQKKIPSGKFTLADMSDFSLPERYDVVQCLFSSIGYLQEGQQVINALLCFKKHLKPGGIILVEPWFSPEQWNVGVPFMLTIDEPEIKICRMNTSGRDGKISQVHFHYLIGKPEGVEHFEEDHSLALYTVDEMLSFFQQTELQVEYDPEGIFGRGLYVARE